MTTAAPPRALEGDGGPGAAGTRRRSRSAALCLAATGTAVGLAVHGHAGLWMVLMVAIVAVRLSDPRHTVVATVPAAAMVTATTLVALVLLTGELALEVLSSPTRSRTLLVLVSVAVVPLLWPRHAGRPRGRLVERVELVACAPAVVVLLLGSWLVRQDLPQAADGLLAGWDNGAHVLSSAALTRTGDLSYDANAYPRGVHALVALSLSVRGAVGAAPEHLDALLRTQSLLIWLMYGLLTATVGLVTLKCAVRRGLPPSSAAAAALVAGSATLTPDFFNFTVMYGFQTTIAVGVVLAIVSLEILSPRGPVLDTVLLATAVTAAAHTYQLALPVVAVPLLLSLPVLLRSAGRSGITCLTILPLLSLAAWPPAWSVIVNEGVSVAGASGAVGPLPALLLAVGVLSTASLLAVQREQWARTLCSTIVCLAVVAVVTAQLAGASLTDYYPRKILWHLTLMTLPVSVVVACSVLRWVHARTQGIRALALAAPAAATAGALMVLGLALPGPYMSVTGGWGVPAGVVGALMHPEEEMAVCELDSRYARQVTFRLQHFYDAVPTPPPLDAEGLPACAVPPTEP